MFPFCPEFCPEFKKMPKISFGAGHGATNIKKIIVVKDDVKTSIDENGLVTMGIYDFLLDEKSLDS